jgi:phosphatidylserine/phosphatidylglycerophosphate/cardiolipin synthase-like enzyme
VFSVALSLALGASAPILPASSVASGAAIAVCFAPEEDCAAFAVRAINNAEREILVGAYGLTTGSGIIEALVRAEERGVDVRLIADRTTPCERESGIEPLAAAGVPIWIDAQARIAHGKPMVIAKERSASCSGVASVIPKNIWARIGSASGALYAALKQVVA